MRLKKTWDTWEEAKMEIKSQDLIGNSSQRGSEQYGTYAIILSCLGSRVWGWRCLAHWLVHPELPQDRTPSFFLVLDTPLRKKFHSSCCSWGDSMHIKILRTHTYLTWIPQVKQFPDLFFRTLHWVTTKTVLVESSRKLEINFRDWVYRVWLMMWKWRET